MIPRADLRALLRTPYREGGRDVGLGIDCLGVVVEIARHLGLPLGDPWREIEAAWRNGTLDTASGFPAGWQRIGSRIEQLRDGDVLLFYGVHPWSAIVYNEHVWSADAQVGGVFCRPLSRWSANPAEVWRHGCEGVPAAGADR